MQNLPTTGTIDSRLGRLELVNGFPSDATVKTLYDALDFQRACQAYLWALPYVSMAEMQREQRETFGARNLDYVDYFDYKDKLGILTANATTPYTMAFPNLGQTGPLVFEIPSGPMAGGISDFWQRPITGVGEIGPDKGAGGRFLILGPSDKGPPVLPTGYHVFRSPTNNVWVGMRALDPDRSTAAALAARLRIYSYAQRGDPPPTKHLRPEGRTWSGEQPRGLAYWELLARVIGEEPAHERDRLILGMLVPLGIEKGKPFRPDERQQAILIEAADVGEMMARANSYAKRFPGSIVWPGTQWEYSLFLSEPNQETPNYTQLDERASWFYEAAGVNIGMMSRKVGAKQVVLESQKDSSGAWLDGGKHYTLHVPADAPVAQFWSFTIYDNESRCMIDTGSYPDRSSRDDLTTNADGSADLYFGPTPPPAKPPANWIKTLPDKGWFTYFRLHGPTQAYFDKTWALPDIARLVAIWLVAWLGVGLERAWAQDKAKDPPKLGWSNSTDLSLVVTAGNSAAQTWGFTDQLRYVWKDARFELEGNVVRSNTSDDRFFLVAPGIEFPVGGAPSNPPTTLIKPDPTLDVATYLLGGSYERNITPRFFWNTGASWDRNEDAGILSRYIAHAGVGNKWVDRERRRFATSYGISYTDREEEKPDAEKDRRFAGGRLGWDYMERFTEGATFDHEFATNINLSDAADYSINTTSALTVSVVSRVSLKVSLQWLYEHEPALEADLDVVAFVEAINPDGVPGSGDERFRTLTAGGSKLVLGSADARKDRLDTIFRTALVIKF